MLDFVRHALTVIACLTVGACLLLWVRALARWKRGEPILDLATRRAVPWTLTDLLLIGGVGFVAILLSQFVLWQFLELPEGRWNLEDLTGEQQIGVLAAFSLTSLFVWLMSLVICRVKTKATAADLGWNAVYGLSDVRLGLIAYVMLIVPVLLIHVAAQLIFASDESHPFIDVIMHDPRMSYLLPIAFAALIAAPVVEEYFFRVLLQGWLERITARLESPRPDRHEVAALDPVESQSSEAAATDINPDADHLAPAVMETPEPPCVPAPPALPYQEQLRWLVIGLSSLAFSSAHIGQGPAPISLFVLAIGLGYIYQRTHRVLPCIVVHFLVNLTAVVQLAMAIAGQTR